MAITDQIQWAGLGCAATGSASLVNVTTTATVIAALNISRTSIIIQNRGAVDVYLGYDNTVTDSAYYFLVLSPGDAYEINATNMYVGALYGITASSTADISVGEV